MLYYNITYENCFPCLCLSPPEREFSAGAAEDTKRAVELFRRGCVADDAHSCTALGIAYRLGKGVPEDLQRAHQQAPS